MHHALDGVGSLGAVELLLLGLPAPGDGHSQDVFAEVGVEVQDADGELLGLLGGGVHGVALLPQELPVAQEGTGGFLPAEHGAPLVIELGQVPVGLDDVLVVLAEQGLARLINDINFADYESRMYFDRQLRKSGLFTTLEEMGIQDGDTVSIYDFEFDYER